MFRLIRLAGSALLFAVPLEAALGQRESVSDPRFYSGPVRLTRVSGTIELASGGPPTVRLRFVVANASNVPQAPTISFRDASGSRLALKAGDSVQVDAPPSVAHWSGNRAGAQSVTVDLLPMFDSLPMAQPASVDLDVVLPAGVPALIRSSWPAERDTTGGRTVYRFIRQRAHLTMLTLVYTTGPVTVLLEKRVQPAMIDQAGPVTVTLTVRNVGSGNARDLLLEDSYDPRDFIGQGAEFQLVGGKENDRRLLWSRRLEHLPAAGVATVTYTLAARLPVGSVSLNGATATMNGALVGVSNKVWMPPVRRR